MSTCSCPPQALDKRTIQTQVKDTLSVTITICNCDRRQCKQCSGYGWKLGATRCPAGHPL